MEMTNVPLSRTLWAELHVESFIAPAFVAEFVFRSPQVNDPSQKEVVDLLIHRGEQGILVSQKCQDDPTTRSGEKLERWARKKADDAASQLHGALRRVGVPNEIWCDHRRRGRVSFPNGLPNINHAIAAVEAFEHVALQDDLPLEDAGTPISYLSVSDFLNLSLQLRTVPELTRYLDARRSLPDSVLRSVGSERALFYYYLLRDGTFAGFTSLEATYCLLAERGQELDDLLTAKAERDEYAGSLEHVADQLAGRHPNYRDGLSQAVIDFYEPDGERHGYLIMQSVIAGLMLGERAELGQAFNGAVDLRKAGHGLTHIQAMVSSHPEYVFILGSFSETDATTRNNLLLHFDAFARAAMANYSRTRCLIIFDRDGKSYEVAHVEMTGPFSPEDVANGKKIFSHLKVFGKEIHVRPN